MKAAVLFALAVASGFGTVNDDDWPPQRFRGVGTTRVAFVRAQSEINRLCGKAPPHFVTNGCSTTKGLVVLPDPCGFSGELAQLECHELAHRFGGWKENHPR